MRRIPGAASLAAAVVLAACAGDGRREAHGTIEVRESDLATLVPARVVSLRVQEGDSVEVGDTLVTLSVATTQPDIEQQRARVRAALAGVRDLEAGARPAEVRAAEAELALADAELGRAQSELARTRRLRGDGVISEQALEVAETAEATARARQARAAAALRLVRQGARSEQVRAARAEVDAARAALSAAEARAADLVLTAPVQGVVLARYAEPGDVLGAGIPAITVGEVARPRARVYVAADVVPALSIGQTLAARIDGAPGRTFAATIRAIASRAEFTPRVALTPEERADLLFGVELEFADGSGALRPGLPVSVELPAAP